jgi:hypothetical protein
MEAALAPERRRVGAEAPVALRRELKAVRLRELKHHG